MKKITATKAVPGLYQKIINLIPEHTYYYELFAGSAAIAQILPVSKNKVINDIDPDKYRELKQNYTGGGEVLNMDGIQLFNSLKVKGRDSFIFIDLPYLRETQSKESPSKYKFDLQEKDHVKILTAALQMKANVMIIHPICDLYDKMLFGWYWTSIKVRYHKKTSNERLYMNYPPPQKLHTTQFLGNGRTDRQRIKRKCDRWLQKLENMPPLEKQYILDKIKAM